MDKLIQTIQEEINQLMNSRFAKTSDVKLLLAESTSVDANLIDKIILEYKNGEKIRHLAKKYNLSVNVIYKKMKQRKIPHMSTNIPILKDEKEKDILNGMSAKEFSKKWGTDRSTYYLKRKALKKDLVN
jgi:hypothetical protein